MSAGVPGNYNTPTVHAFQLMLTLDLRHSPAVLKFESTVFSRTPIWVDPECTNQRSNRVCHTGHCLAPLASELNLQYSFWVDARYRYKVLSL